MSSGSQELRFPAFVSAFFRDRYLGICSRKESKRKLFCSHSTTVVIHEFDQSFAFTNSAMIDRSSSYTNITGQISSTLDRGGRRESNRRPPYLPGDIDARHKETRTRELTDITFPSNYKRFGRVACFRFSLLGFFLDLGLKPPLTLLTLGSSGELK